LPSVWLPWCDRHDPAMVDGQTMARAFRSTNVATHRRSSRNILMSGLNAVKIHGHKRMVRPGQVRPDRQHITETKKIRHSSTGTSIDLSTTLQTKKRHSFCTAPIPQSQSPRHLIPRVCVCRQESEKCILPSTHSPSGAAPLSHPHGSAPTRPAQHNHSHPPPPQSPRKIIGAPGVLHAAADVGTLTGASGRHPIPPKRNRKSHIGSSTHMTHGETDRSLSACVCVHSLGRPFVRISVTARQP